MATNAFGFDFGGNWLLGAALIAVLAPVYIFYGFESAGDISEETKDAGVKVPRSMRQALIWGGISSFILIAALLLAMPDRKDPVGRHGQRWRRAVHPRRAAERAAGLPAAADHLRVLLVRDVGAGGGLPAGLRVCP